MFDHQLEEPLSAKSNKQRNERVTGSGYIFQVRIIASATERSGGNKNSLLLFYTIHGLD